MVILGKILIVIGTLFLLVILKEFSGCIILILIPIVIIIGFILVEDGKENKMIKESLIGNSYELSWTDHSTKGNPIITFKDKKRFEMNLGNEVAEGTYRLKLGNNITSGLNRLNFDIDKKSDVSWYQYSDGEQIFREDGDKQFLYLYDLENIDKEIIDIYSDSHHNEPNGKLIKVDVVE